MQRNDPPTGHGHLTVRPLRIEWGHCDPAGIVFHPRFVEFFDWSCVVLIESASGLTDGEIRAEHGFAGIPIVSLTCDFRLPVRHGDHVQIESRFIRLGRASFEVGHRLLKEGEVAVTCEQKRVWCGWDPDRPGALVGQAIPEFLRERFWPSADATAR